MRHQKKKGRISRRTSWRKATLKSMANHLFTYQRIETTLAKAKALKNFAEPIITTAKNNPESIAARRRVFAKLCDKTVVKSLFDKIAPLYKEIPGGYTRIMALGNRRGDGAKTAIIELTKRTISDDELLGIKAEKEVKKGKKKQPKKAVEAAEGEEEKHGKEQHSAPEVEPQKKEEHVVEDVRKEKARKEQKKVGEQGIFKRFRRKSG